MTATSLPGTIGSHWPPTNPGRSSRSGLTSTNSAPRSRAARRWSRPGCPLAGPAGLAGPGALGGPAGKVQWRGDPGRVPEAVDDVAEERRGIGVVPIRVDRDDRAIRDLGLEGAPVRRMRHELARHTRQNIKTRGAED